MTFIVTLMTLLVERFFDWSHLRYMGWFTHYERWVEQKSPSKNPYVILAAAILPVIIIVSLLGCLLDGALYGFVRLIFEVIVLMYCYGPQNLWADAFASINTLSGGDAKAAQDKLQYTFGIQSTNSPQTLHFQLLDHIFMAANRRIFAVVFWYVIAGLPGAILYRLITLATDGTSNTAQVARKIEEWLDYIPVRIFSFLFALGGHFVKVLSCWRKKVFSNVSQNEALLTDCGLAALGVEDAPHLLDDGSILREAVSLLDRVFIITLVLIALFVLMS